MARFYLDENMPERLVGALGALGHDAISTNGIGEKGASDPRQLTLSADLGRILVTHNEADFAMLHEAWRRWARRWGVVVRQHHAGIVVVRQAERLAILDMADRISALSELYDRLDDRLFVFGAGRWSEVDEPPK